MVRCCSEPTRQSGRSGRIRYRESFVGINVLETLWEMLQVERVASWRSWSWRGCELGIITVDLQKERGARRWRQVFRADEYDDSTSESATVSVNVGDGGVVQRTGVRL